MSRLTRAATILTRSLFLSTRNFHATACKMSEIDSTQQKLLSEPLIMVDEYDCIRGYETKRDCHLKKNILEYGMLHRAFSVFLFNKKGELLLQQRSNEKVTFPGYVTNSCCSHPLYNESEMEEYNHIGIRRAAKRRLNYELGIPESEIKLDDLKFLTRIHYKAASDKMWGEHEIDYVFFVQKDVTLQPRANEVKRCWYVSQTQVQELLQKSAEDPNVLVTPWFKMITQHFLYKWWASLNDLSQFENDSEIHKMPGIPTPILQL
ncbi:hypothetical protein ACROYT_G037345 [Oculina patagonica]